MTTFLRDRRAPTRHRVRLFGPPVGTGPVHRLRRRGRRVLRRVPAAVWVASAVSAVAGAAAGCHPTGGPWADALLAAAFAGAVALLGSQAGWAPLLAASLVATVAGAPIPLAVVAGLASALVVVLERRQELEPTAAAGIAAVAVQGLLRLGGLHRLGASAVVAAVAVTPLLVSGVRRAPSFLRNAALALAAVLVLGFAGSLLLTARASREAKPVLERARSEVLAGITAAKAGDREGAAARFRDAAIHFAQARSLSRSWWSWPARQAPLAGPQVRALDRIASSGRAAADLAYESAQRVDPDRLRMVDGRIDLAAVARYEPIFRRIAHDVHALRIGLRDEGSPWLLPSVKEALASFRRTAATADDSAATAAAAARLAPDLLGGHGTRRYFVAMVTPAEARASGGFMGNYAILTVADGRLDLGPVGRKEDLNRAGDPATKAVHGPADYVRNYAKYDPAHTWENVTMSPDFPSVAQVVADLFEQSGGPRVDGVIRVDPIALQGLLALTGPVDLPGLPHPLDRTNAADFLLREQYAVFGDQAQRIDLLGDLATAAFDKFTAGRGARPAKVGEAMGPALRSGSLAFWFRDADEQAFVRRIGADAGVPAVDGHDSFGVTTQNAGGSKIDVFLQRTVRYDATVDARTGATTATATVTLHNGAPPSGLPFYVIGNEVGLPLGTSRSFVSLSSPLALRGARLDGQPLRLEADREQGRNTYRAFLDLAPGATRTITLRLQGHVDVRSGRVRFDYVPQVLTKPDRATWRVRVLHGTATSATTHPGNRTTRSPHEVEVAWPVSAGRWSVAVGLDR